MQLSNNKIQRKQKRFFNRLSSAKGIVCSDSTTKVLVLCNEGQATGLCKESIMRSLETYLPAVRLPKVSLPRGESYCFFIFDNVNDSMLVFEKLSGKVKLRLDGPIIFLNYTSEVPQTVTKCLDQPPSGLKIIESFISEQEETMFIKLFDFQDSQCLKNRQVLHYGYEFRYGTNDIDIGNPLEQYIPAECEFLWKRLREIKNDLDKPPDQLTVNKYLPGQGIASHVDTHSPFGPYLVVISLGDDVVMDWKHRDGRNVPICIPRRSLYIMEGEARYDWQHGIQSRTWDPKVEVNKNDSQTEERLVYDVEMERKTRISLTFRWIRSGKCECNFPYLCDSKKCDKSEIIEKDIAIKLEELHVHKVYDKIAPHFSTTRHKPWPKVLDYVSNLPSGSVLLDLGSGNGKNICMRGDIVQIALERSEGLLGECKSYIKSIKNCSDCFRGDMLNVPMLECCADAIICIAVIHHFSNKERRIQSLRSISRLLRKNGTALITVWARDQTKANYLAKENDSQAAVSLETLGISLPVHENRTQFKHNDLLVPWKLRSVEKESNKLVDINDTLLRYYHVFDDRELLELCNEIDELAVREYYYEQGNWCIVVEKVKICT